VYSLIIIYSLIAVFSWILVDTFSKANIKNFGRELACAIVLILGTIPMLIAFFMTGTTGMPNNMPMLIVYSLLGGALLFLGYVLIYHSVSSAGISNSYILLEIQPPILMAFGILALNESLNTLQVVSIMLIFIGIGFVVINKKLRINKDLLPSVVGNIMWSLYWFIVIIAILQYKNFVIPLLLVRMFSAIFAFAYYFAISSGKSQHIKTIKNIKKGAFMAMVLIIFTAGVLDGLGNLLFSFVAFSNRIVIGSAILSIEPIIIWFIGILLYKEKVTHYQRIGFAIATLGYLALSLA